MCTANTSCPERKKWRLKPGEVDDLEPTAAIMGHDRAATGTRLRHVRVLSSQHTQPNDGERRDIQHDDFDENIAANGRGAVVRTRRLTLQKHREMSFGGISKCEPYSDLADNE